MFFTLLVFIFIFGLLVFVHEFGHFIVAKKSGIKVEEFAFGFPPRLFSVKKGGTRYSLNLIPLGGYVKMLGEEEEVDTKGSFHAKSVWTRIAVVGAGVVMNFILAIVLMTIGFTVGMTPLVSDPATLPGQKDSKVMVAFIQPDSAAQKAGIENGNIIEGFASTSDLQKFTKEHVGQQVELTVDKGTYKEKIVVTLSQNPEAPLGVSVVPITKIKQPVWQAFVTSIKETGKVVITLFDFIGKILKNVFTTGKAGEEAAGVVGPVGLFNFTSQAINFGWIYVLQLVALLSVNLGLVNILPFPALDGGKILFLAIEGIFRRKVVRQEIENIIHLIGFALLILLLIVITYRDIIHYR